jgi:hypothetical protein
LSRLGPLADKIDIIDIDDRNLLTTSANKINFCIK